MNKYIGNTSQLHGVEEHRLVGGRGDGMRLLEIRNGKGLEMTVSGDRCADISRLTFKGNNLGYFAPCGYVSPHYYDGIGAGFLKSFTAGFLTTCGLRAVGSPCNDAGEDTPLHGTIGNTPAEILNYWEDENAIYIQAVMRDAAMFAQKLVLTRKYTCYLDRNEIEITDTVKNIGSEESPFMMLYHFNMGYPLLTENSVLSMPSNKISARDKEAEKYMDTCLIPEKPQAGFVERCYYYDVNGKDEVAASIYNKDINTEVKIIFDAKELDHFTQWKMMGEHEYVMGLEPGNCTPDGRDVMRKTGKLKFLKPGEEHTNHIKINISDK